MDSQTATVVRGGGVLHPSCTVSERNDSGGENGRNPDSHFSSALDLVRGFGVITSPPRLPVDDEITKFFFHFYIIKWILKTKQSQSPFRDFYFGEGGVNVLS